MQKYQDEYVKAFRGEEPGSEDEVAVTDDATAEGASETPAVAVVIDAETAVDDAADAAGIPEGEEDPMYGDAAQTDGELAEQSDVDPVAGSDERTPEDIQREKSWEGRLRKREEELAAREAALGETKLAEGGEVEEVGDEEIAEIQSRLAEDFGDEFVQMIMKLASHEAKKLAGSSIDEKLGPINQTLEQAMSDVTEALQNLHFDSISRDHEDFQEIVDSEQFGEYIQSLDESAKPAAIQVLQSGTPRQVVRLLNDYKAFLVKKEEGAEEDPALDAAEGIRGSAPVSLPARPTASGEDEYKAAWDSM